MAIFTVTGKIAAQDLGKTYIHEHLYLDLSRIKNDDDTRFDDVEAVTAELRGSGLDSLVEVTNLGMGRNVEVLRRISEQAEINVIASTGFYKEPFLPEEIYHLDEREMAKILIGEITKGIGSSGIKAHVIGEVGTSKDEIRPMELKVLMASIRAHLETGHPIFTHTTLGTMALEQLDLFAAHSVDPGKILIGHMDLNYNRDYHLQVAQRGCYLGFDTIGKLSYESDEVRIDHIKYLIEQGHGGQIVLSQDMTRKSHLKKYGGIGFNYLQEVFLPQARKKGIKEEDLRQMLVDNPRTLLSV